MTLNTRLAAAAIAIAEKPTATSTSEATPTSGLATTSWDIPDNLLNPNRHYQHSTIHREERKDASSC
jgi:hypothetical protein